MHWISCTGFFLMLDIGRAEERQDLVCGCIYRPAQWMILFGTSGLSIALGYGFSHVLDGPSAR